MPVASPVFLSVNTSRAIALVTRSTLPVDNAGITRHEDAEKSAYALQLRPHCEQKKQEPLSLLIGLVSIDKRDGITGTPIPVAAFLIISSCRRGLGGGRKMPSGSLGKPSLEPNTPNRRSILS